MTVANEQGGTDWCWLVTHPEIKGCCCQCKFHLKDYQYAHTGEHWWDKHRGWICVGFQHEGAAFSGFAEHGMCEMFMERKEDANSTRLPNTP